MKVQRSHLRIAVFVLVLAVGYNLWAFFLKPSSRTNPLANRQQPLLSAPAPAATGAPAIDPVTIPAPPPIDTASAPSGGRDPFLFGDEKRDGRLLPAQEAPVPDPTVRSILYSATRQTAIVENRMVSVGDSVGPLKVVQIDRDAVVFVSAGGDRRRVALHRASSSGIRR